MWGIDITVFPAVCIIPMQFTEQKQIFLYKYLLYPPTHNLHPQIHVLWIHGIELNGCVLNLALFPESTLLLERIYPHRTLRLFQG